MLVPGGINLFPLLVPRHTRFIHRWLASSLAGRKSLVRLRDELYGNLLALGTGPGPNVATPYCQVTWLLDRMTEVYITQ